MQADLYYPPEKEYACRLVFDVFFLPPHCPFLSSRTSTRKGKPMNRTKNVRKMKAMAKAIALSDKYEEKASKNVTKKQRTLSAKKLFLLTF
ncbi:hypothetical protein Bca52824_070166 [Brassica carinata]|uniref:Uncharacterized protein n=1 Tax=Brassica carinata TaxID=52824 RepID=A0A8X7U207_BRACI|nr:hypothetical protein Bca52824_070166 [Brassica carinata]